MYCFQFLVIINNAAVTFLLNKQGDLLMKVIEESEKACWKLYIQNTKILASSPTTSWQIDGEKWKQWQMFFSSAPKSLWMGLQPWN